MYSSIDKTYKMAQYASYMFGDRITEEQLKQAIMAITHSTDPRTMSKYIAEALADHTPIASAQFRKEDGFYVAQPNRPKTPNELLAEAYQAKEKREQA